MGENLWSFFLSSWFSRILSTDFWTLQNIHSECLSTSSRVSLNSHPHEMGEALSPSPASAISSFAPALVLFGPTSELIQCFTSALLGNNTIISPPNSCSCFLWGQRVNSPHRSSENCQRWCKGKWWECMAPSRKQGQLALTLPQFTLGTRVSIRKLVNQGLDWCHWGPFQEILKEDTKIHKYVRLYFNEQFD